MLPQLPEGFKAAVDSYVEQNRIDVTTDDILQLYGTSALIYSAANYRANNLALVDFKIVDPKDQDIPESELIVKAFKRNFSEVMRRSELSICFWGVNLLLKTRNKRQQVESFRWLNPAIWSPDTDATYGLKGFNVLSNDRYKEPVDYVHMRDAVYMHTVDFRDDFDGVSPAEVAFLYAGMDVEIAHTSLSFFKNMAIPAAIVQPAAEQNTQPDEEERNTIIDFLGRIVKGAKNFGRTIVTPTRWEWQQLQTSFDQLGMPGLAEQARNAVFMAFQVPIELVYPSASGYAQALEARRAWIQTWLVPQAQWYASAFTEQVLRPINPKWKIVPAFDSMPGMKEALDVLTTNVISQVQAGVIDLYTAQKKLGYEPEARLKNMYLIENVPVPIDRLVNWWNKDAYLQAHTDDYGSPSSSDETGTESSAFGESESDMFGGSESNQTTGEPELSTEEPMSFGAPEAESEQNLSKPQYQFVTKLRSGQLTTPKDVLNNRNQPVAPKRPSPITARIITSGQTMTRQPLYTPPARMLSTDEWEELKRWRRFSSKSRKRGFDSSIIPSDTYVFARLMALLEQDDQRQWDSIKGHWSRSSTELTRNLTTIALKHLESIATGRYYKTKDTIHELAKAGMDYSDASSFVFELETSAVQLTQALKIHRGLAIISKLEEDLLSA